MLTWIGKQRVVDFVKIDAQGMDLEVGAGLPWPI